MSQYSVKYKQTGPSSMTLYPQNEFVSTVADDAVYSFTLGSSNGIVYLICQDDTQYSGVVIYRASSAAAETLIVGGGADFEVSTGALAGTTGSDAKVTLSTHTNGKMYIENRTGGSKTFFFKLIFEAL